RGLPLLPQTNSRNDNGSKKYPGNPLRGFRGSNLRTGATRFGVSTERTIGPPNKGPSSDQSSFSTSVTGRPVANRVIPLKAHPFVSRFGPPHLSNGNT